MGGEGGMRWTATGALEVFERHTALFIRLRQCHPSNPGAYGNSRALIGWNANIKHGKSCALP